MRASVLSLLSGAALLAGCGEAPSPQGWSWSLPPGVPAPFVPPSNPMSSAKVELGRRLFFSPDLSRQRNQSCASCHHPDRAFAGPLARSVGSTGQVHPRNAPSLVNVAYATTLTWANPLLVTLERQIPVPLFGEHPEELAMAGREALLLERLVADPAVREGFARAFPEDPEPARIDNLVRALAAFVRSLTAFDSPYDRARAGDPDALSPGALRGRALFFSEETGCASCHAGPLFSDAFPVDGRAPAEGPFHALPSSRAPDPGLFDITARPEDRGRFRTPSLRNVTRTAPYLHDGSALTIEAAIAAHGLALEAPQVDALVAFLGALEDLPEVGPSPAP